MVIKQEDEDALSSQPRLPPPPPPQPPKVIQKVGAFGRTSSGPWGLRITPDQFGITEEPVVEYGPADHTIPTKR